MENTLFLLNEKIGLFADWRASESAADWNDFSSVFNSDLISSNLSVYHHTCVVINKLSVHQNDLKLITDFLIKSRQTSSSDYKFIWVERSAWWNLNKRMFLKFSSRQVFFFFAFCVVSSIRSSESWWEINRLASHPNLSPKEKKRSSSSDSIWFLFFSCLWAQVCQETHLQLSLDLFL